MQVINYTYVRFTYIDFRYRLDFLGTTSYSNLLVLKTLLLLG